MIHYNSGKAFLWSYMAMMSFLVFPYFVYSKCSCEFLLLNLQPQAYKSIKLSSKLPIICVNQGEHLGPVAKVCSVLWQKCRNIDIQIQDGLRPAMCAIIIIIITLIYIVPFKGPKVALQKHKRRAWSQTNKQRYHRQYNKWGEGDYWLKAMLNR